MEDEYCDDKNKNDAAHALFSAQEYTEPGSLVTNCIFIFGSNDGDCPVCIKPCLHPLSTEDLQLYFHVAYNDWLITLE